MKKSSHIFVLAGLLIGCLPSMGQKENLLIGSGNRYYKQKLLDQSQQEYLKAIQLAPENPAAHYNLGNAQFRKNDFENAVKSYDASIEHASDKGEREKGLYNKGVALVKQQKLNESIDAWKGALKIDPADSDARENLQKALLEMKKKQPPQPKNDPKQQKNKQDSQTQQQPKPQPSKLSKQQVEQLLNALQQKEKQVQEKMNQNKVKSLSQPDKDW